MPLWFLVWIFFSSSPLVLFPNYRSLTSLQVLRYCNNATMPALVLSSSFLHRSLRDILKIHPRVSIILSSCSLFRKTHVSESCYNGVLLQFAWPCYLLNQRHANIIPLHPTSLSFPLYILSSLYPPRVFFLWLLCLLGI